MSKVILGLIAGIVFGALDVGLMLPMSFPDKTSALLGAFTSRFAIGFVIGCVRLPGWPGSLVGLLDRKSTRLNSSHRCISYAVFCLKKKTLQAMQGCR